MTTDPSGAESRAPRTLGATPAERERLAVGGPLENDPRGGWRFQDPPPRSEPNRVDVPDDGERRQFIGNAQYPPHSYPQGGTQGTWDDSVVS